MNLSATSDTETTTGPEHLQGECVASALCKSACFTLWYLWPAKPQQAC